MPRTNGVGTTAPPGSGAQRCAQASERKHRTDSTTGPATTSNAIDPRRLAALCADLVGCDICTAAGIIARSNAPVPALCRRLIKAGKSPKITQISDRRIGITVGNNRAWQQSRERGGGAPPPEQQNAAPGWERRLSFHGAAGSRDPAFEATGPFGSIPNASATIKGYNSSLASAV